MENIEDMIKSCSLCGNKEKLEHSYIQKGKSKILILGESPAKDGWIVSGRAFYNREGELQASGKTLQRLLNLSNLSIEDINFTECCKCIIDDRSTLCKCMQNCKKFLLSQLQSIDYDTILTMGKEATQLILDIKINKLADYVGQTFMVEINGKKKRVIPIYHPSPINPLGYKGNEKVFKNLVNKK